MGLALFGESNKTQANMGRLGLIHGFNQQQAILGGPGLITMSFKGQASLRSLA